MLLQLRRASYVHCRKWEAQIPATAGVLTPMFAMITAVSSIEGGENIAVESTLMDGDCCKVSIRQNQVRDRKGELINGCRSGLLGAEGVVLICG